MKCPLCGHEFDEDEAVPACAACLMSKSCKLVKCPNCGYEMPKEPKWLKSLKGLLSKVYKIGSCSDRVGKKD